MKLLNVSKFSKLVAETVVLQLYFLTFPCRDPLSNNATDTMRRSLEIIAVRENQRKEVKTIFCVLACPEN